MTESADLDCCTICYGPVNFGDRDSFCYPSGGKYEGELCHVRCLKNIGDTRYITSKRSTRDEEPEGKLKRAKVSFWGQPRPEYLSDNNTFEQFYSESNGFAIGVTVDVTGDYDGDVVAVYLSSSEDEPLYFKSFKDTSKAIEEAEKIISLGSRSNRLKYLKKAKYRVQHN